MNPRQIQVAIGVGADSRSKCVKASVHSFKRFTSRLLKIIFIYAPIISDECHADFIWTLPVQLRGTLQKKSCPR